MRFRWLCLLCCSCGYITNPNSDPADPILFSLHNVGKSVLYLPLSDERDVLDSGLTIRPAGGFPFFARLSCSEAQCADGCDVQPCMKRPAVRSLAPDEALIVSWDELRHDPGDVTCPTTGVCLNPTRVGKGRYEAQV